MASMVGNLLLKRAFNETTRNKFGSKDAKYEKVQVVTKNGKKKTVLQEKQVPSGISNHNAAVLNKVRRRAHRLDAIYSFCGIKWGVSSVIGLVPALGDAMDGTLASMVVLTAFQVKPALPLHTKLMMAITVFFDFVIGLVPFLGDFLDAIFKANTINAYLLERALSKPRYNVGNPETMREPRILDEASSNALLAEVGADGHVQPSRTQPEDLNMGAPPRYESFHNRNEVTRGSAIAPQEPARPSAAKVGKEKRSGSSWLQRFGGGRAEPDLEQGRTRGI